jgi:SPX domain protein involved in polyphosphate accumulation/uncharacterized membrane protein YidH (DUF202 family)
MATSFSSYFAAQRHAEYGPHYMDFDTLQAQLRALAAVNGGPAFGARGANECVTSLTMTAATDAGHAKFRGRDITEADWLAALDAEYAKVDAFASAHAAHILQQSQNLERAVAKGMGEGPGMRDSAQKQTLAAAALTADEFLRLEKFANVNYLGFHRILKLHDQMFPRAKCRDFYIKRMHTMSWVKGNHSKIFVNLSRLMSNLRGDVAGAKKEQDDQAFVRKTTKYWIRTEDISRVKYAVLKHLPVFQFDERVLEKGDAQLANSVYLDNDMLDLYHGRINKTLGSQAIRLRWYGDADPTLVFIERKTHQDSWTGEESVKERFTLKEHQVVPFMRGEYTLEQHVEAMRAKNKSEDEIAGVSRLFSEIYSAIESKQLQPTMRSQYMRVAYQVPFDETVRVSLDTNLAMITENPEGHPTCVESKMWYRNPSLPTPRTEITRFPHAVLEVKLALKDGEDPPAWVQALIDSGSLCEVHKFSKFLHGCAILMEPQVREVPYWVDDDSIQTSLERSRVAAGAEGTLGRRGQASFHLNDLERPLLDRDGLQFMGNPGAGSSIRWRASNLDLDRQDRGVGEEEGQSVAISLPSSQPSRLSTGANGTTWCFGMLSRAKKNKDMKPRKIPMRIEPKTYFANERTFLSWLHMAVTLGSVGGFKFTLDKNRTDCEGQEYHWVPYTGAALVGVAIVFIIYALRLYMWRGSMIRERRMGPFDDRFGPFFLALVLFVAFAGMVVVEFVSAKGC